MRPVARTVRSGRQGVSLRERRITRGRAVRPGPPKPGGVPLLCQGFANSDLQIGLYSLFLIYEAKESGWAGN
jgi:hypothetical protein